VFFYRQQGSVLFLAFMLGLAAQAQVLDPQIAGRVVRADNGMPVQDATIQLLPITIIGRAQFQTAKTDRDGEYHFQSVRDGVFLIEASAEGFVRQTHRRDDSPEGEFQSFDSSTRLRGVDFQLKREAVIRGLVTDIEGKPAGSDVAVAAVRKEKLHNGSERLVPESQAKTDVSGQFVLRGLPAGSYFVCVNGPDGYNAARNTVGWYRETWYGNVPSKEGAIEVPLTEGQEQGGVRITVEREQRYRVVVWPSGPEGGPKPDRYDLILTKRNHSSIQQADGSYVIPDMPAGHYTLVSTAWSGVQYVGQGETSFDVSNSDVSVQLQLGGLGEIGGSVKVEGIPDAVLSGVIISIESDEGAAKARHVDAGGRFTFDRVLPGKYLFRLLGEPSNIALRSVRCGGAQVTKDSSLRVGDRQIIMDCELVLVRTGS
jgi:hypothetical protein